MEFAFLPNSKKIMTEKGYIIPIKEKTPLILFIKFVWQGLVYHKIQIKSIPYQSFRGKAGITVMLSAFLLLKNRVFNCVFFGMIFKMSV